MLRQLTLKDIQDKIAKLRVYVSLHIPVIYKDKIRFVKDTCNGGSFYMCELEKTNITHSHRSELVLIKDCELITDYAAYEKVVTAMKDVSWCQQGVDAIKHGFSKEEMLAAVGMSVIAPNQILKITK